MKNNRVTGNMDLVDKPFDVVIVGAGPIGIACGVEARLAGLSYLILEKGCLMNAVTRFPSQVIFFSTADLLEIGDVPFIASGPKPSRTEILRYYRRVTEHYDLSIKFYETVTNLDRQDGQVLKITSNKSQYTARNAVLATGFYDHPNLLKIPGEDLPKVSHYYTEPYAFFRRKVAVIGGQNSAAESALDLYRNGADVTLIHRRKELGTAIKYWVLPDIQNRIKEGSIRAFFDSEVEKIEDDSIVVRTNRSGEGTLVRLENDFVFALTGYRADLDFLEKVGIRLETERKRPAHNSETMETNVQSVYIAGVASGGMDTNRIFIENGRLHAKRITADILKKDRASPTLSS